MAHPVDVHVGKRLRLRRKFMGMSQNALGATIGITFQQIQKYESGANRMGSSRLYDFANALKVPVSYFFEAYDENGGSDAALGMAEAEAPAFEYEDKLASRESMEILRSYHNIADPTVRKSVLDLVKSLAENDS